MKKITFCLLLILAEAFLFKASAQSTVSFAPTSIPSVIEGNAFQFIVKLNVASVSPVTVNVSTSPGTADASDYTTLNTTVTIPAGQLSVSLSIQTTNDFTIEQYENLSVHGQVLSGNTVNTSFSLSFSIIDNDTPPTVRMAPVTAPFLYVIEGNTLSNISLSLSNPYHSPIIVNLVTIDGTTSANDYIHINTTITIPADQTSSPQTVAIVDDSTPENDENFVVTATITSGNTFNSSVSKAITIRDNDTTPTLSMTSPSVIEGEQAQIGLTLNRPFNSPIVIQLVTADGTATAADYTATNITKTIPAGATSTSVTIPTIDDVLDEAMESFNLTATVTSGNTTNVSILRTQTIVDNDGLPDFILVAPTNVVEGEDVSYEVWLTHPSNVATVINLTTNDGTAGSADYTSASTTVTIPAGEVNSLVSPNGIPTILDQLQEGDETFTITANSNSGNTFNTTQTKTITIRDNYNVNAYDDTFNAIAGVNGTFQLLGNDLYHGLPLNASNVTLTLASNTIGATLNSMGILSIPGNSLIVGGYHNLSYTICETTNPTQCDTAGITIQVQSPLVVTYTPNYVDFNGDGYVSAGDLVNYQFSVSNLGSAPITTIDVSLLPNWLTMNGGPIVQLNQGQTDTTTFSASRILTQYDINFNTFQDGGIIEIGFSGTYSGYQVFGLGTLLVPLTLPNPDGIKLNAFVDANGNGIQEAGEINFPLGQFNYEINNNGTVHHQYTSPFYLYETNPATSYNLTYTVTSQYASQNTCSVSYQNVTVIPGSGITTYNFPVTATPYNELSVTLHNYAAPPRPGFQYENAITYTNNSNQTVASGVITFTNDSALSVVNVSNPATITPTGFTYTFNNLLPYETRHFWVRMQVPNLPIVSLGQMVTNSVSITTLPGDILPSNNTSTITQAIIGAYDPNIKTENHGGRIVHATFTPDDYLTYTIQFENTGTANAINVEIRDQLDSKLDETTLTMVGASASYSLERVNSNLVWKFDAIDLPPSVPNSTVGHGYITFKIKPKSGYTVGDIIPNNAQIYFDFNPPIVTNTVNTEFVATLSTADFVFDDLKWYPNPVTNVLTILNTSIMEDIEITSVLGQKIMNKKINDLQTQIDLSELSIGIYIIRITGNGHEKTVRIIKK